MSLTDGITLKRQKTNFVKKKKTNLFKITVLDKYSKQACFATER